MALPSSGPISLSQVNVELGLSATASINMNSAAVRTLFQVPSGPIAMSNGYGKSNAFTFTISSNQTNANLRTLAVNAGWNQSTKVVATIASGVYISSNSTGTPALTVNGSFPGGVELVNSGFIIGMGGNGGAGGSSNNSGSPGSAGGLALSVSSAITITNNGTIGGGGGGGGGGGAYFVSCYSDAGGGGGGGRSSAAANSSGGSRGQGDSGFAQNGGAGTVSGPGSGGSGVGPGGRGGDGGGWGASGNTGGAGNRGGGTGGSGGGAVTGNSNITWAATGTRLGSIS